MTDRPDPRELSRAIRKLVPPHQMIRITSEKARSGRSYEKKWSLKWLKDWGLSPDAVDDMSDEEITQHMEARMHPGLK